MLATTKSAALHTVVHLLVWNQLALSGYYERSAESLNLQYKGFIGDGDTKSYLSLVDKHPNGHKVETVKKKCVGRVQKRFGTALRKLKTESGTKKLEDHKTLGGKRRLTKSDDRAA